MTTDLDEQPTPWEQMMADHERRLVPGARVQVRLGECPQHGDPDFSESMYSLTNGLTGIILSRSTLYPNDPLYSMHQYMIRYDSGPFYSGVFCAAELLPLDGPDAGEDA